LVSQRHEISSEVVDRSIHEARGVPSLREIYFAFGLDLLLAGIQAMAVRKR
jgi:hypothetical protein